MTTGAVKAGEAFVEVALREKIKEGARRIQSELNSVAAGFKTFGAGIAAAGATATAAFGSLTGVIGGAALSFAEAGSTIADMSARTGIGASSLSALSYAAKLSGSNIEEVELALRKMQKAIGDAVGGSKSAAEKFASIGLSIKTIANLTPEQQFAAISAAIAKIDDPTLRASKAMEFFGKSATQILPLITSDISATIAEARKLGAVMSDEDAAAADALGDAIDSLKMTFAALYNSIGAAVAGPLTTLATVTAGIVGTISQFVTANRGLSAAIAAVGVVGTAAGAALLVLGGSLFGIGAVISGIAYAFPLLAGAFTAVSTAIVPLLPIIAAVAAGLAVIGATAAGIAYVAYQAGILQKVFSGIGSTLSELSSIVGQTFGGITRALSAGEYTKAAQILWAGIKTAFFAGAKAAYLSFVWLFENALSLGAAFAQSLGQTLWNVFRSIPRLLRDALSGGASIAAILAAAISEGIGNSLDVAQARAQAELDRLTADNAAGPGQPGRGQQTPIDVIDAEKASKDEIQSRIDALRDETLEMQLGANAFDLYKLKIQGATEEQLNQVRALQAYRDQLKAKTKADEEAKKAAEDAAARGKQLTEQVRTPFQVLQDKIKEVNSLLADGQITQETADRAIAKAREDFQAPMREAMKSGRNTIANINTQEALDVVLRTRASYAGGAAKSEAEDLAKQQLAELQKINQREERGAGSKLTINIRRI